MLGRRLIGPVACLLSIGYAAASPGAEDSAGLDFFERKIRPVLVTECYACHSARAEKLGGGLRLDTRAGVLAGGDSGPAVVPGKPDESPLLEALRHEGVAMPPKKKLPEAVVADFEDWIRMGAPDPRAGGAAPAQGGIDLEAGRAFWAYRPPRPHAIPEVGDDDWPSGDIDRFILARLEAHQLRPVADADRTTLIRRLSFDLIGMPPTPAEIDAFLADRSPAAYERLVDRLLASPHFGERWGRHWLDVARFAESLTLRGFILKPAWRYRDYVIAAFNDAMPYDRFLREQVAGDLYPAESLADRRRQLVAVSFLLLGNTNLEEQDKQQLRMDFVDEQIDTLGKAILAQTIACARCHDHKFDPIPTEDYYALAGILRNVKTMEHANVSRWLEAPLPVEPEVEAVLSRHEAAVAALEGRIKAEKARLSPIARAKVAARGGAVAVADLPGVVVDDSRAKRVGDWKASTFTRTYIGAGYVHDSDAGKGEKTLTFQPDRLETGTYEVWLAYSPGKGRASNVPVTVFGADGERPVAVDMRAEPPLAGRFVSLGKHRFERDGLAYVLVSNEGTSGHVTADAVVFLPIDRPAGATRPAGAGDGGEGLRALEAELRALKASVPPRDTVLSVAEEPKVEDCPIHIRGSVHTLGPVARRGFLRVATSGAAPSLPRGESGRRELAEWLAAGANPLTARVFVNRAWQWLFGAGLVRTTDNFGMTGEAPSHPELLDALALRFRDEGWSVKGLVRRLVLSRAYRLSSADDPTARAADPENRLLWRMNRRRLDAECLRDAMLCVGGTLRTEMGGPSFPADLASDYGFQYADPRRSVYAPVFRNALPELFEAFDFADPSMVVGRRDVSTVAPQALFLLNHPFVIGQAREAARRLRAGPGACDEDRITLAYRRALGRPPSEAERGLARRVLADTAGPEDAWATLVHLLFASIDFRYID